MSNKHKMTLSEELKWRGFINQTTYTDLSTLDKEDRVTFYHGFDASAPSQTVGNLAAMMMDLCFLRHGHNAIVLAGGSTSLVGDPGGRDSERQMQSIETISENVERAKLQLQKIYKDYKFTLVNNLDWTKNVTIIDFLRDIGKYFNVGEMVKRDYIKDRIGGNGISYTEFSYTLLQGYDFLHLYDTHGCTLQLGGSDQWGNCLSGVDLIRKKRGVESNVITLPLIINKATGKKFGKSEAGAVWLDPEKTTPFEMYQFWLNTDDESVQDYIKIFTEITKEEYDNLIIQFNEDRSTRFAQKYLAFEVTKLVHGVEEAWKAKEQSESLFDKKITIENLEGFSDLEIKLFSFDKAKYSKDDKLLVLIEDLVSNQILSSKRMAREFLENGSIYIDYEKVDEKILERALTKKAFILRIGKKSYYKIDWK
jgi:tyrosyl-tRNA synthetase